MGSCLAIHFLNIRGRSRISFVPLRSEGEDLSPSLSVRFRTDLPGSSPYTNPEMLQQPQGDTTMRFYKWLPAVAVVLLLVGCNTMEGFGEDVQDAGGAIENQAE